MSEKYLLEEDSTQWKFFQSRNFIQFFTGGFGNGKSTGLIMKILMIMKDYPGCSGLLGRSTRTKLEETTKKIFFKWCPKDAIDKYPTKDRPSVTLKNGSTLTFGYIRQEGKGAGGDTTSNVLSATYDFIAIDQIEDPEITYKDFIDMHSRLRGTTPYRGNDTTMPVLGPNWLLAACNPTRNWVYRKVVKPLHLYHQSGIITDDLLIDDDGKLLVDLYNGPTSENVRNLPAETLKRWNASHKGAMRKRFLEGKWEAYEGLVYPDFDLTKHVVSNREIRRYHEAISEFYQPEWIEGLDYGIASPSCHLLGFTDPYGNVIICDGHYEPTKTIGGTTKLITEARKRWDVDHTRYIEGADPSMFRKSNSDKDTVGKSIAQLFRDEGVYMNRGNNNKINGITKINEYLHVDNARKNPFTGGWGSPRTFVSDELSWFIDEATDYYWKKSPTGEHEDEPVDRNDHAMDAWKYMMSKKPNIAGLLIRKTHIKPKYLQGWMEGEVENKQPDLRHRA